MWKKAVNFTSKGLIYIQLCNRDDSNICVWFNIYLGKSQNIATVRHYRFSRKTHNIASATVKNPKISTSFDQFDSFYTRKRVKKKKEQKWQESMRNTAKHFYEKSHDITHIRTGGSFLTEKIFTR